MTHKQVVAGLAGALLTGCALQHTPGPAMMRADASLRVTLITQPTSPRQMDPTRFTVTLHDARGRPMSGCVVGVNLQMPAMDMGPDEVTLSPQAAGRYTGVGRFTMSGTWRVTVTVRHGPTRAAEAVPITVI